MKILIVSDTHGCLAKLEEALEREEPIDRLIHLGDVEGDEDYIRALTDAEVDMVAGNNDYFSNLPGEKLLKIGKHQILITHGHFYRPGMGVEMLRREGLERGADIVMYGHTHRPFLEKKNGLTVLNPGSLTYPRQEGRKPSYMIMEIDASGKTHFDLRFL